MANMNSIRLPVPLELTEMGKRDRFVKRLIFPLDEAAQALKGADFYMREDVNMPQDAINSILWARAKIRDALDIALEHGLQRETSEVLQLRRLDIQQTIRMHEIRMGMMGLDGRSGAIVLHRKMEIMVRKD